METIKSSTEISSLFAQGKRIHTPHLTFIVLNKRDCCESSGRVAFIAGKKNGNAVWRNSAKRRMRAICNELQGPWQGFDVVFLAKPFILKSPYQSVLLCCEKALRNGGIGTGSKNEENC